jgi:alginate O-acetyltransferase complex protein AlgI
MARPDIFVFGDRERLAVGYIIVFGLIAFLAPNTQQLLGYDHARRAVGTSFEDKPVSIRLQFAVACLMALGSLGIQRNSEFIYFRF